MFYSWQILKCNLKFVPVSNLIESLLHRLPRVHWGTIKILLRLQLKNISDQRTELFHFFSPKLDPDSYYDDNFKIFSVLVWNLKSKNERNLIFSAGNKNTDGARQGWTGQCLCLHCCCFMFMIFLRMIAVTGDPPVCLGEIILTWHRYSSLLHLSLRCEDWGLCDSQELPATDNDVYWRFWVNYSLLAG